MKISTTLKTAIIAACLTISASTTFAAWPGAGNGISNGQNAGINTALVSQIPATEPTQQERDGLIKMREEEKLARDVYIYLFNTWQNPVFANISKSEQRHMDAIKILLDKYGLEDPVAGMNPGTFKSTEMQELYNNLIAKGSVSLKEAFQVGATIEDLDIKDLEELIGATDNEDILLIYQNLMKGSRNHMRAFATQLKNLGINYQAQFLSQEEVDKIINSPWERGRVDKDGNRVSGPQGRSKRGRGFGAGMGHGMNFIDLNGDGVCDNLQ